MNIVAEIGCNHQGDFELAKKMILSAYQCGADYVKFQKRNCDYWKSIKPEWSKPHPNGNNAFGATYYEHREALEFAFGQHYELKEYCNELGIGYACSVWDMESAKNILALDPDYIKIPSACNLNFEMIDLILDKSKIPLHISLGMSHGVEINNLFAKFINMNHRVVFYHCTSGYPVPFNELNLLELKAIKDCNYESGYSGHHLGIAADIAALTLGATWLERHFTLDRTMKGTDHAASLEPSGLKKLIRDIKAVEKALTYKHTGLTNVELEQRDKLKWQQ